MRYKGRLLNDRLNLTRCELLQFFVPAKDKNATVAHVHDFHTFDLNNFLSSGVVN